MQEQVNSAGIFDSIRSLLSKAKIDNLLTLSRHHFRVKTECLDERRNLIGCSDGGSTDSNLLKRSCGPLIAIESKMTRSASSSMFVALKMREREKPPDDCMRYMNRGVERAAWSQCQKIYSARSLGDVTSSRSKVDKETGGVGCDSEMILS